MNNQVHQGNLITQIGESERDYQIHCYFNCCRATGSGATSTLTGLDSEPSSPSSSISISSPPSPNQLPSPKLQMPLSKRSFPCREKDIGVYVAEKSSGKR